MKITNVTAYPLAVTFETAQVTSQQAYKKVSICLVRIDTDTGLYGVGEALARFGVRAYAGIIETLLAPVLVGQDPEQLPLLRQKMRDTLNGRSGGMLFEAIAALDIALWDLRGKALGVPVSTLLGGRLRNQVPVYASSVMVGEDVRAAAERLLGLGFNRIKIKTGADIQSEIERVRALREHVGPRIDLMVDANYIYTEHEALYFAEALRDCRLTWLEEPINPENRAGYLRLAARSPVALAAGESEFTAHDMTDLLAAGAIQFVQPDVARCGGISESFRAATVAGAFDIRFAPHVGFSGIVCVAASLQMAAAAPNLACVECMVTPNAFRETLAREPAGLFTQVRDGMVDVPDAPGLGIEIDWQAVEALAD
jgi:galactonate dehydratase